MGLFVEQEITLSLSPFARPSTPGTIKAQVCGALAYHRSLTFPSYWSISHVPTGFGMVDHIPTEEGAHAIIGLAFESGVDWSEDDPDLINRQNKTPAIRSFVAAAKQWLY